MFITLNPRATLECQTLYANVPYFKGFLKLYQKAKSLTQRILALTKIGLTKCHAGKRKRHQEVFKDVKPLSLSKLTVAVFSSWKTYI